MDCLKLVLSRTQCNGLNVTPDRNLSVRKANHSPSSRGKICRHGESKLYRENSSTLLLLYLDRCHAKALECYSESVLKYVSGSRSSLLLHSLSIEGCLINYFVPVLRLVERDEHLFFLR